MYNKMIGIYKIINPKGKTYIGQSTNIKNRKYYYASNKCDKQPKLYNSIQKYGWEQHIFEIIEECGLEQLNEREIYWGSHYGVLGENGLNLRLGNGRGACSEETKQKQRIAKLGIKQSKKTIEKRTNKLKGIPKPDGFGENHSKILKGIPKPEGFGEKLSKIKTGVPLPLGTGIKIGKTKEKPVIQFNKKGDIIGNFDSAKKAAEYICVHEVTMRLHLGGKYKTCKKFIFKYKDNG
jgi:group I intron endonuclease